MFKKIYQSEPPRYRTPQELTATLFGWALYNDYLITPPRIYAEEIYTINGMWVQQRSSATTDVIIQVQVSTSQVWWPSWNNLTYNFNATTGEYMGRQVTTAGEDVGSPGGWYGYAMFVARDNSLWMPILSDSLYMLDPVTHTLISSSRLPGLSRYGQYFSCPLVDREQNLLIDRGNDNRTVKVFNLTTGALIRSIETRGAALRICAEDESRAYVHLDTGMLMLIDYVKGETISLFKAPWKNNDVFTYDRTFRRLLSFVHTPVTTEGQCTSVIKGWYPVPLATHLSPAIPLVAPRKGRSVPTLILTCGDIGEPVAGQMLGVTVSGAATAGAAFPVTDAAGEAVYSVAGTTAGSATVDVTATVPDPE